MAAGTPLTRLALGAGSVADDLGFVALNDVAGALGDITADYRVIGGHMVTMLAARWQMGAGLYRETGDVDLGIPPVVARDRRVVSRLKDIDYRQVEGNRFARKLSDIPAGVVGESGPPDPEALIDVLIPAYTSRARENVQSEKICSQRRFPACQWRWRDRQQRSRWNYAASTVRRCGANCHLPTNSVPWC